MTTSPKIQAIMHNILGMVKVWGLAGQKFSPSIVDAQPNAP
jgi:hypothetical protein